MNKTVLISFTILCLLPTVFLMGSMFPVQPVIADSRTIYVDDDNTSGPWDGTQANPYQNITSGLEHASANDTIFVHSGTYYEHLNVNKPLTLVGESKESTIVDGNRTGTVIRVTANNIAISQFTVRNSNQSAGTSYAGIKISGHGCNITGNHVTKNKIGIFVTSQKSRIKENIVANNGQGIALYDSSEVTVKANNVSANTVGISLAYSSRNTIVSNRVANSSEGGHGITLSSNSFNNTILNNDLVSNYHGMWLSNSFDNWAVDNTIANNELLGIELAISPNNTFCHNNFVNNPKHIVIDTKSMGIWDDGYPSGGNYWSDYNGTDLHSGPFKNETGSDGISDTSYIIDENNKDNYPLMGMFSSFNTSLGKQVNIVSNSTIDNFEYFESNSTIMMHVSNITIDQTHGFCRLRISHNLLSPPYNIAINDNLVPYTTLYENETLSIIYFSYEHSTLKIIIIPEFPSFLILPLFMIATLLAVIVYRTKVSFTSHKNQRRQIRRLT